LTDYPACDKKVKLLAEKLWGSFQIPEKLTEVKHGKGSIFWGGNLRNIKPGSLYPDFESTVEILKQFKIPEDFRSANNNIRFGHRKTADRDIYFVANRAGSFQTTECMFRAKGEPELWAGTTGEIRKIAEYSVSDGITTIPMEFYPYESYFIVFNSGKSGKTSSRKANGNFPVFFELMTVEGPWNVSFDPKWGGPEEIVFEKLQDWTAHEMRGIKYYSGIVTYKKSFNFPETEDSNSKYYIDLGVVNDIARVKLNGKDVGVVWCAPWRIEISDALQEGTNELEIEVANRWINRLLGDRLEPDTNVRTVKFENGFLEGKEFTTGRYTFTIDAAMRSFKFTEPLPSGLLGPVKIEKTAL
jgi:hypothetical protein